MNSLTQLVHHPLQRQGFEDDGVDVDFPGWGHQGSQTTPWSKGDLPRNGEGSGCWRVVLADMLFEQCVKVWDSAKEWQNRVVDTIFKKGD